MLRTRIILLSSFGVYFFCICHLGSIPNLHQITRLILPYFETKVKPETWPRPFANTAP